MLRRSLTIIVDNVLAILKEKKMAIFLTWVFWDLTEKMEVLL